MEVSRGNGHFHHLVLCNRLLEGSQVLRLQLLLHLVELLLGQLAGLRLAQPLQLLPRGVEVRVRGLGEVSELRGWRVGKESGLSAWGLGEVSELRLESGQVVRIVGGPWDGLSSTFGGIMNPAYRAFSLITS